MNAFDDVRYLFSKETVDDRALNRAVLAEFQRALAALPSRPRVLEVGAGVGTMLRRLVAWNVLGNCQYTLIDRDLASLEAARKQLEAWADSAQHRGDAVVLTRGNLEIELECVHGDALAFAAAQSTAPRFDVLMANAVLDLMDLDPALRDLWCAAGAGALYWFSINFDGDTIFLPELPEDSAIMELYHRTMDERVIEGKRSGDSRSGRHLLEALPRSGASLLAAGSSDWVVFPQHDKYVGDEEYFLRHILNTVYVAVRPFAEAQVGGLTLDGFDAWYNARCRHLTERRLCFVAHQLDVFGRTPLRRHG